MTGGRSLSPRELDILLAMARGLDCAAIGETFAISPHTVRKHRSNMFAKTGTRTAAALVAYARSRGWLEPAHPPPVPPDIAP